MSISAEWVLNKNKQRIYAVSHAKASVRNSSTVDKDLTKLENRTSTVEGRVDSLNTKIDTLNAQVFPTDVIDDGSATVVLGKATTAGEIIIPTEGWEAEDEMFVLNITNSAIDEETVPVLAIAPQSFEIAQDSGLKPYCRTFDGTLRLYSQSIPTAPLIASLALIGGKTKLFENLPVASSVTPGVVKIGNGIIIDDNGAISINTAILVTDEDMVNEEEMVDTIHDDLNS